jgi:hypothetical protein
VSEYKDISIEAVELLIQNGLRFDIHHPITGMSPIDIACLMNKLDNPIFITWIRCRINSLVPPIGQIIIPTYVRQDTSEFDDQFRVTLEYLNTYISNVSPVDTLLTLGGSSCNDLPSVRGGSSCNDLPTRGGSSCNDLPTRGGSSCNDLPTLGGSSCKDLPTLRGSSCKDMPIPEGYVYYDTVLVESSSNNGK